MILSKDSIQKLLDDKHLKVIPAPSLKEASIKMHLSSRFAQVGHDFTNHMTYTLKPKEFVLALTKEKITMPLDYAGLYDGYTHLSRKGIITHMGSMFVDPGSDCHITLEIFNASDHEIILKEGIRVGHLIIIQMV